MIQRLDADATEDMLPFPLLVAELERTVVEYTDGRIVSPERLVIPLADNGVMLSMPASADDIAVHKLVNVCPSNFSRGLATINGEVVTYDAATGVQLFALHGPTVTGRRTAAISLLAVSLLSKAAPKKVALVGTGKQASTHAEALAAFFPGVEIVVAGISSQEENRFCESHSRRGVRPFANRNWSDVDVVITLTTSKTPVYQEDPVANRLVIGVGAFTSDAAEVGKNVVLGSSIVVDDPVGARHEAGDLIQAGVDWSTVASLGQIIMGAATVTKPVFFKSVGCAAWDLAACRVARDMITRVNAD